MPDSIYSPGVLSGGQRRGPGRPRKNDGRTLVPPSANLPAFSSLRSLHLNDREISRWLALVETRGTTNELYKMADRFQAQMVITGILTIQGIYQNLSDMMAGATVEDLNKLTSALNKAMSSINQSLNHLGLTGLKREEEISGDVLTNILSSIHIDEEIPPKLQEEYIVAKRNLERVSAGNKEKGDSLDSRMKEARERDTLSRIKEPIKIFDGGEEPGKRDIVIDGEADKVNII